MKKNISEFVEEITDNFSELLVETFFIRYFVDFKEEDVLKTVGLTNKALKEKIAKRFSEKLKNMNYSELEIAKMLK